jgi:hypothetical protein
VRIRLRRNDWLASLYFRRRAPPKKIQNQEGIVDFDTLDSYYSFNAPQL